MSQVLGETGVGVAAAGVAGVTFCAGVGVTAAVGLGVGIGVAMAGPEASPAEVDKVG